MKSIGNYITSAVIFSIVMIIIGLVSGELAMSGMLILRFIVFAVVFCAVSMIVDAVFLKLKK